MAGTPQPTPEGYAPLTPETIAQRLGDIPALTRALGTDPGQWQAREVGDGNLNLAFIVEGPAGAVVIKQALPYVRLVGDSWPLPLNRAYFEYHALTRQDRRDPGRVPAVLYFDETQALIVMEYLSPHIILRRALIEGRRTEGLATALGQFCARTLFRGSDLHMAAPERKADLALFAGNVELCDITENLVYTDPYFDAAMNRHTSPQLDAVVADLRADRQLKIEAQHLKTDFCSRAETMLHGDLHTGSIMVTERETRVIDPEFALYGPMGFDVGMLIANFLTAYLSQPGHAERPGARADMQAWILDVVSGIWASFAAEFRHLWRSERTGILYPPALYEDQGHATAAEQALDDWLQRIWRDAMGHCGIEIHRRILGLAHNAEFETIADPDQRAACEAPALRLGRHLVVKRGSIVGPEALTSLTQRYAQEPLS